MPKSTIEEFIDEAIGHLLLARSARAVGDDARVTAELGAAADQLARCALAYDAEVAMF